MATPVQVAVIGSADRVTGAIAAWWSSNERTTNLVGGYAAGPGGTQRPVIWGNGRAKFLILRGQDEIGRILIDCSDPIPPDNRIEALVAMQSEDRGLANAFSRLSTHLIKQLGAARTITRGLI